MTPVLSQNPPTMLPRPSPVRARVLFLNQRSPRSPVPEVPVDREGSPDATGRTDRTLRTDQTERTGRTEEMVWTAQMVAMAATVVTVRTVRKVPGVRWVRPAHRENRAVTEQPAPPDTSPDP